MKLRIAVVAVAACLVGACAPAPGQSATVQERSTPPASGPTAPESSEEPTAATSPTTDPTVEPEATESSTAAPEASESPATAPAAGESPSAASSADADPSAEPSASAAAAPVKDGWTSVDKKLTSTADIASLGVPDQTAKYLTQRLNEDCRVEFTVFASHSDGFLVADESGVCDGIGIYVYGSSGGPMRPLVEFSALAECSQFEQVGLPKDVPSGKLFPDGLMCLDGGQAKAY